MCVYWNASVLQVLEGPHFYAIADQGKLLVAVPIDKDRNADTI